MVFALSQAMGNGNEERPIIDLGVDVANEVGAYLKACPAHAPTPLVALPALADRLGIGALHMKDESSRLGLGSFKALGGAYAVIRLVCDYAAERLGRSIAPHELRSEAVRAVASNLTVACATDGNHGRSVAAGARLTGCKCVIFVHAGVSDERVHAIERFGATMVRVQGTYDDSVEESRRACAENGWMLVSDMSWSGYESVPTLVMQGYTVVAQEALRDIAQPPTHIFLQAGVGGFAASIAGFVTQSGVRPTPKFIIVEPERADCFFQSNARGERVKIAPRESTVMAMLECYEPALLAWQTLAPIVDACMTVDEQDAIDSMRQLAYPCGGDQPIIAGESGGVGLAGLMVLAQSPELRNAVNLTASSRVLLFNTEGATDPTLYQGLVGKSVCDVLDRR